jgi:hypothetical protein
MHWKDELHIRGPAEPVGTSNRKFFYQRGGGLGPLAKRKRQNPIRKTAKAARPIQSPASSDEPVTNWTTAWIRHRRITPNTTTTIAIPIALRATFPMLQDYIFDRVNWQETSVDVAPSAISLDHANR